MIKSNLIILKKVYSSYLKYFYFFIFLYIAAFTFTDLYLKSFTANNDILKLVTIEVDLDQAHENLLKIMNDGIFIKNFVILINHLLWLTFYMMILRY